jgi:glucose/arabinose dehydrogenase
VRHEIVRRPRLAVACAIVLGFVLGVTGAWLGSRPGATASAGGAPRETPRLELVVGGLSSPVDVVAAPGDRQSLYVAEQTGRVRVVRNGIVRRAPFLDLSRRVRANGEQGLLGLAFHPGYAENRRLYVHYSDRRGDTRVVEVRSDGERALPGSERALLHVEQPYENHNGGGLTFGPDGKLYLGLGDGGSAFDPERRAQDTRSLLGKLLRADVERARPRWEPVALGLRNPWRFAFAESGDLYVADVGQDAWEEVNVLPAGERELVNFGWDLYEGPLRVEEGEPSAGRLAAPIAAYPHGEECSVTGGRVYRGELVPALRGRYLYGDYCSGRIWSLRWTGGDEAEVREEPISLPTLTAFGEGPDRELYLAAQSGALYRLTYVP